MLTRVSLAVVFIGIGVWEILQPGYWSAFIPRSFPGIVPIDTLIIVHGMVLLVIGIAVLAGAYLRVASLLAVFMMLAIIVVVTMQSGFTDITIRDTAIAILAAALFFDDTKYMRLRD